MIIKDTKELNYKPGISQMSIIPALGSQNRRALSLKANWSAQQAKQTGVHSKQPSVYQLSSFHSKH